MKSNNTNAMTRRSFLKAEATGALSVAMFSTFSPIQTAYPADSPNERFTIGFIGCGGMGGGDSYEMSQYGDIVALADVNIDKAEAFKNSSRVSNPSRAFVTQDYRRILDRNDIDVVGISTPDHWHVKIAVEALLAGKHVFCQKPLTLTIEENQLIRRAMEKTGKVFQVGSQQRLDKDHFMLATLMVRKGLLGDIKRVVVTLPSGPQDGPFPVEQIPKNLDWNMFLGQAPYVEYRSARASGRFRYFLDYSGGVLTDWGAHHMDCALWALDQLGAGRGLVEIDGRDVTHASELDAHGFPKYDDRFCTAMNFKIKAKVANGIDLEVIDKGSENGVLFEGAKGRIFVDRGRVTGKPIEEGLQNTLTDADYVALNRGKPIEAHKANFFRCIREGGKPASEPIEHTYAMTACHLCVIAGRLGRVIRWDPTKEVVVDDDEANAFLAREQRKGFELPKVS